MEEKIYLCPVCGAQKGSAAEECATCGFEPRLFAEGTPAEVLEGEQQRLARTRIRWETQKSEREALLRRRPLAYLVTEHLVVYPIAEGVNTFGSQKADNVQRIILSGMSLRPVHFKIETVEGERRVRFLVSETCSDEPTVFVNGDAVTDGTILRDGDTIVVRQPEGAAQAKITFRIDI